MRLNRGAERILIGMLKGFYCLPAESEDYQRESMYGPMSLTLRLGDRAANGGAGGGDGAH